MIFDKKICVTALMFISFSSVHAAHRSAPIRRLYYRYEYLFPIVPHGIITPGRVVFVGLMAGLAYREMCEDSAVTKDGPRKIVKVANLGDRPRDVLLNRYYTVSDSPYAAYTSRKKPDPAKAIVLKTRHGNPMWVSKVLTPIELASQHDTTFNPLRSQATIDLGPGETAELERSWTRNSAGEVISHINITRPSSSLRFSATGELVDVELRKRGVWQAFGEPIKNWCLRIDKNISADASVVVQSKLVDGELPLQSTEGMNREG